jgi:integrase
MATLEKRIGKSGTSFRLVFWINSKRYSRTLDVTSEKDAKTAQANAEKRLTLYLSKDIEPPQGADLAVWITTDGRMANEPTSSNMLPLGELFDLFIKETPEGHLADSTLLTMRIHLGHAAKILGEQTPLGSLTFDNLQSYINRRVKQKNRQKKAISPVTIRKEITTLSGMWTWAASHKKVKGAFPGKKLKYPATTEAGRFQTWHEIERQIKNGGDKKLWDCLFLNTSEIGELLKHAEKHGHKPYIHPMLVTAAHTGARRSELIRSRAEDIDFKAKILTIRERKRERGHHGTRSVPLSPLLSKTLKKWLAGRTSGPTFQCKPDMPLTKDEAHDHFAFTFAASKWEKLKGWHVLRHSFASNCAARGLDQRIIDSWMGHQSEEMQKRYRHNFPDQHQKAMQSVFG